MGATSSHGWLDSIDELLVREGLEDARARLKELAASARAAEEQRMTVAEVTRALLESEKTYRLVFSHELDPMSLFDPRTGALLDVNDAWVQLYGYSREEALRMKVTDVSAEPAQTQHAIAALPSGATTRVTVRWHRAKDGTVFPVELVAGSLRRGDREVMYATMRDITQRENAVRALERSEASFRALIESMPDGVIVHRHGRLVYLSPSARRMLGYGADEDVTSMQAIDIVHPDDRGKVIARVVEMLTHGGTLPSVEERLLRRDGTSLVVEITAIHTVFDGEPSVLAIARDLTLRKEMESQLVMNDRLASLGRLAASVGHELNNPLAYVLGNVTLMQRELSPGRWLSPEAVERCASYLRTIEEGAQRMRHIVNDLKTLARAEGEERVPVDVQHLLDVCLNMAEHEILPRARLVKDYGPAFVRGTEARLGQVFLNLLLNAAEAVPAGAPEDHEIRVTLRASGDRVMVEIGDTGHGIPPEVRDRIFEPFFTTKDGVGTGLGLSISHGIVTALGGSITAEPRPERGTVFRVSLPSADGPRGA